MATPTNPKIVGMDEILTRHSGCVLSSALPAYCREWWLRNPRGQDEKIADYLGRIADDLLGRLSFPGALLAEGERDGADS